MCVMVCFASEETVARLPPVSQTVCDTCASLQSDQSVHKETIARLPPVSQTVCDTFGVRCTSALRNGRRGEAPRMSPVRWV